MWGRGPLGPIGKTPVGIILLPCPPHPRGLWSSIQRDCGHECSRGMRRVLHPQKFFYFAFKMVYFGAFWADLLTMRDTCDTTTNTAAAAF